MVDICKNYNCIPSHIPVVILAQLNEPYPVLCDTCIPFLPVLANLALFRLRAFPFPANRMLVQGPIHPPQTWDKLPLRHRSLAVTNLIYSQQPTAVAFLLIVVCGLLCDGGDPANVRNRYLLLNYSVGLSNLEIYSSQWSSMAISAQSLWILYIGTYF